VIIISLRIIIWVNANRFDPLSYKYSLQLTTQNSMALLGGLKAKNMHIQVLVVGYLVANTALYLLLSN